MTIREAEQRDYPALKALHAKMGLDYVFDPSRNDFLVRSAAFEDDKLVACVLGRLTTEGYLLLDPEWDTPRQRLSMTERLISVAAQNLKFYGVQDVHIWLPPKVTCFSRRLKAMGFSEANWKCLTANL